ncbi:imidazolonepropionase [Erwinia sp. OLTSP20]|uniref:imidazolonepropionase n=1 Tax=unclassified Erwinia TaxID=2622719 RepID=UPI000C1895FA|nr:MULTISPECIES: imidazolonepropionase [unclassified Erwinia]PIJ48685.1 imidazolonepropionase [Erwinia sp. OAMSP11]PIJ69309.1 imidazolonepropionase [Erwinia sp. OLSSP12]PIJ79143.1 imidazolonepropionase [Erwinia sp. OLCASP19]PIJ80669.1 imidazolonepropionase [Erwinia sp. OLMTSP26]PIJ82820.1 imidazolonepropionase [Erwinia sp. OLMDSP33]
MPAELMCDSLWMGADIATMQNGRYSLIKDGAIAVQDERIVWLGKREQAKTIVCAERHHFCGGLITPGLIDCHTHLLFAGNRSREFEQRLNGVSYADIAAGGGGILSTVRATREASQQALVDSARPRLQHLLDEGVTTVEIKSGYGLGVESELRMLRAIRQLAADMPVDVKATCLAAHAIPPEFRDNPQGWIQQICQQLLPQVVKENLADAVDAFCEHLAFSPEQVSEVFTAARALGLPVKIHAGQLSPLPSARLAAGFNALSADHLEYIAEEDVVAMAASGTVAVLLPGAFYLLRETQRPPVALFRKHGVAMALASDANPGTSPALSLRLMLNMGCTLFAMTPEEALSGVTLHAAKALGCASWLGSLEVGKRADFVHWPLTDPAELVYWLGGTLPCETIYRGKLRDKTV